jgi:hypothetical protein
MYKILQHYSTLEQEVSGCSLSSRGQKYTGDARQDFVSVTPASENVLLKKWKRGENN